MEGEAWGPWKSSKETEEEVGFKKCMHPKPNTAGFTSTAAFLIRTRWCIIDQDTEVTASVQSAEIASSQSTQNMHMCSKHVINIALKSSQICPGNKTSIKYACPVRDLLRK